MNTFEARLKQAILAHQDEVVELTQTLVRFPSILKPPIGKEGDCQQFVAQWMKEVFDEVDIFELPETKGFFNHPAHWKYNEYSGRPDVVGILKGSGTGRSLLFNGHVDVVPEDPLPWIHDPFGAEIENGKLYGRGSADCKGGLAAALVAVKVIRAAGFKLRGDVIVHSVVGEEYAGGNGTLAAVLRGHIADAGISVEPSGYDLGTSTRCGRLYEFKIRRSQSLFMSSSQTVNPAALIVRIAEGVNQFNTLRNGQKHHNSIYKDVPNSIPASIVKIKAGCVEEGGLIGVPSEAWLHAWIYGMPEVTEEQLDLEVKEFFDQWIEDDDLLSSENTQIIGHTRFLEGSEVPLNHPLVGLVTDAAKSVLGREVPVGPTEVTGDLGFLVNWGQTPSIVFGPLGGNLHDSDEFVEIQSLLDIVSIYVKTIINWCGMEGVENG
jgi:acetylornithine deacetylase